jgi:hypothetical protein
MLFIVKFPKKQPAGHKVRLLKLTNKQALLMPLFYDIQWRDHADEPLKINPLLWRETKTKCCRPSIRSQSRPYKPQNTR